MKYGYRPALGALFFLALVACKGTGSVTTERDRLLYEAVEDQINAWEESTSEQPTQAALSELRQITLEYDSTNIAEADRPKFKALEERLQGLKARYLDGAAPEVHSGGATSIASVRELLLTQPTRYPVYLYAGDTLSLKAQSEEVVQLSLINYDKRQTMHHWSGRTVEQSIIIPHKAIYLVEVSPTASRQYTGLQLSYRSMQHSHPRVKQAKKVAKKGDFLASSEESLKTKSVFEEPRKITLRGQLKAAFSGHYRSIITVAVPPKTQALLYSLRISSNERTESSDGTFPERLQTSYSKHKVFGLTLYEREGGRGRNSLVNLILGDTRPPREENAYCNFYVFKSRSDAKRWQDGTAGGANFSYDVDQSQQGTQSCNGRLIPAKGQSNVYLGFENERFRYDTYIWLEVVSLSETTSYTTPTYSINKR